MRNLITKKGEGIRMKKFIKKVKVMGIVNVTQRGNENDEFEKNISVIYLAKKNLLDQNQKLAQARDLLLPRLMSGKIKV